MTPQSTGTFDEELAALAADLRRLRIVRGKPSYRELVARAEGSRAGIQLSMATLSDAFNGKRLVRIDTLMALVRILRSYDEFGGEVPVPGHNAPELAPWRRRWQAIAALQSGPPAGERPASVATPAPAPAPAVSAYALRFRLVGHPGPVRHLAFPADGRQLAAAADGDAVLLWNTATGLPYKYRGRIDDLGPV
ncbi:hypothetical protein ACFXPJ_41050, partial [Streptomyces goshikiensis]